MAKKLAKAQTSKEIKKYQGGGGYTEPDKIRTYTASPERIQATIKNNRENGSSVRKTYNYDPKTGTAEKRRIYTPAGEDGPYNQTIKTKTISPEKFNRKAERIAKKVGESPMDRFNSAFKKGGPVTALDKVQQMYSKKKR
jgi:hypothetical protein